MNLPFQKKQLPDLSNPQNQQSYVNTARDPKSLLQKEIDINRAEQNLIKKRIDLLKSTINDIPSFSPQYASMLPQLEMDQIELDELKIREAEIIQEIKGIVS